MRRSIARLSHRHAPAAHPKTAFLAGLGAAVGIVLLGWLGAFSALKLLLAPMGASCVLLYSVPNSPLSQPANVFGGHVLAAMVGIAVGVMLPAGFVGPALAVGLSIAFMMALRLTHPPAGAMALVAVATPHHQGQLFASVVVAASLLVMIAMLWHRVIGNTYPMQPVKA